MRLLLRFLTQACTHRFSWPRTSGSGRDYQICLLCGAAYEYDLGAMRQTGRQLRQEERAN